ncbi:MAG: PKD domain-containing protein [Planctomycetaceae bacterium]|nr:PKD domain-containing protein [Planctomycetaceae bacterium]
MFRSILFCIFVLLLPLVSFAEYKIAGGGFAAKRELSGVAGKSILVTQFLHHGLINQSQKGVDPRTLNAGKTIVVTTRTNKQVPFKILQLGPGDFCRLAVQAERGASNYDIYYGIPEGGKPNNIPVPEWTAEGGLLMETRHINQTFSMDELESLQKAFERSEPIGADYVPTVYHGHNPFALKQEPFMSCYTGTLNVTEGGRYTVITSSHHCSFVLIDGKVVASHPGRHQRSWDAKPELIKQINLTPGKHPFQYWHATGDNFTSMLFAWELNGGDKPKRLSLIPPESFGESAVAKVPCGAVVMSDKPGMPDFECRIIGSVPLPDNEKHLIAVQFQNKSVGLAANGKFSWNFGDGLTSEEKSPGHIFFKPGIYSVELSSQTAAHTLVCVNRIEVEQPHVIITGNAEEQKRDRAALPTLDLYLKILETYDTSKLEPETLLQLVDTYQAKIDSLLNPTEAEMKAMTEVETQEEQDSKTPQNRPRPAVRSQTAIQRARLTEQANKYRRLIAEAVHAPLTKNPNFKGDTVYELALRAGGIARDYLDDWKLAGQIYRAAAEKVTFGDYAAECYALAADVALDMRNQNAAKDFLDKASKKVSPAGMSQSVSTYYRVLADFLADTGKGNEARSTLTKAAKSSDAKHQYSAQVALQGSASRNAEIFLREKNFDRVIESLRTWQLEYPAASYDGYITLITAKYYLEKGKHELPAALADRQLVLNPDSAYVDELLLTAAEAQIKAGNKPAAIAYLRSLTKEHPGSPLVPEAQKRMAELEK